MTDPTSIPASAAEADSSPHAFAPDPAAPAVGRVRDRRRRLLWLAVAVAVLAVAGAAAWLVNMVSTARTLQAVTSGVRLPVAAVAAPAAVPAPTSAAAVPAAPVAPAAAAPLALAAAAEAPRPVVDDELPRPEPVVRKATSKKAHAAAQRRIRATGTFARCPALGQAGAVICRWHICNGGAGKEAACRPYLERRP